MRVFLSTILLFASAAFAGESKLSGTGRATAPADYVELTAYVSAECYPTPGEAVNQANKMAQAVYAILQKAVVDPQKDGVFTQGGWASPYSKNIYSPDGQVQQICANTFQAKTSITLKTSDVANFVQTFTAIQNEIYAPDFQKPSSDSAQPVAYAVLDQPIPQWSAETRAAVELEAATQAIADAKKNMSAYAVEACISQWEISRIDDVSVAPNVPYAPDEGVADLGQAPVVNFDSNWLSKSVVVEFKWDGSKANQSCNVNQTLN